MNRILLTCIGTLATVGMTGTAFAAPRVGPPSTPFTAVGPAQLTNPPLVLNCTFTLNGNTGPALPTPPLPAGAAGGTITGGTNTGPGLCPAVTVDAATFTVTSATATGGTGNVNGLVVRLAGTPVCTATGPVSFTFANNGAAPSTIGFSGPIPGTTCSVITNLTITSSPDINAFP